MHACSPKGYASLQSGNKLQRERAGRPKDNMPGTLGFVEVTAWPPEPAEHSAINRACQQRGVNIENMRIGKKLDEVYASKRTSVYAQNKHLGHKPIDCSDRCEWKGGGDTRIG